MANQGWASQMSAPKTTAPVQPAASRSAATGSPVRPGPEQKRNEEKSFSDIIAKAAVRQKFLDFRNGLVLARPEDYAMIHGIGGQDHAPRSGIKCLITDYSVKPSVVVSANMAPEMFPYIMSVCEKNASLMSAPTPKRKTTELARTLSGFTGSILPKELTPNATVSYVAVPAPVLQEVLELSKEGEAAATAIIDSTRGMKPLPPDPSGVSFVAVQLNLINAFITADNNQAAGVATQQGGFDFYHKQDRVNVYKEESGFCPVSVITINRAGLRKNGEVSRLPWTVTIQNFMAPPIRQQNQTTAYNASAAKDKREASVSISDFDMYRCCLRVCRFIELWEMSQGLPLLKQGLATREAQRRQFQNQN